MEFLQLAFQDNYFSMLKNNLGKCDFLIAVYDLRILPFRRVGHVGY